MPPHVAVHCLIERLVTATAGDADVMAVFNHRGAGLSTVGFGRCDTHVVDEVLVEEALGALQGVRLEALHVHLDEHHVLAHHRVHALARDAQPLVRALVVDGPAGREQHL